MNYYQVNTTTNQEYIIDENDYKLLKIFKNRHIDVKIYNQDGSDKGKTEISSKDISTFASFALQSPS